MTIVPDIERQPADVIKRFQEAKLREALRYVAAHSTFYRRLFREHGVDPERVHRIEDLTAIPFTEKSDLQLYNEEFVCVPRARIIDYITTSGTLGDPVTFAMTDADLDRLAYNEQISFACTGTGPGSVFQLMTTIDKRFMAGLAYFLGIRRLGAGIVRVGNGIPELQWDTIRRVRPDTIIVVPSFIPRIIDYAEAHGIDYRASSVRRAVCIGENLREQDFSLNLLGESIRRRWDIELFSTYASTEMATTFTECPCGCGGHHHPELIICELIGDDGLPVADDEAGLSSLRSVWRACRSCASRRATWRDSTVSHAVADAPRCASARSSADGTTWSNTRAQRSIRPPSLMCSTTRRTWRIT